MTLAGDIGGTHARRARLESEGGKLKEVVGETFPSRQYKTLEEIVAKFAAAHPAEVEGERLRWPRKRVAHELSRRLASILSAGGARPMAN